MFQRQSSRAMACIPGMAPLMVLMLAAAHLGCPASARSTWETIQEQSSSATGSKTQPSIRYSQAAVLHKDQWIITHGYFYDSQAHKPRWQHDTWALQLQART